MSLSRVVFCGAWLLSTFVGTGSPLSFEKISPDQGLSQYTVNYILQDQKGFLWFGTQDGLNRYDGCDFKIYKNQPDHPRSLSDNYIRSLMESRDGTLWVGVLNGLNRFDRAQGSFIRYCHDPDQPAAISQGQVRAICEDDLGNLWVGTTSGLNMFSPEDEIFTRFQHDPEDPASLAGNEITALQWSPDGSLWVGTQNNGLDRFDPGTGRFTHYSLEPGKPEDEGQDPIWSLHLDRSGTLWIGTKGDGLARLDPGADCFQYYRYDPEDPHSLSHDVVRCIFEDDGGVLWIGTEGGGLNRFDSEQGLFQRYLHDPMDGRSLSSNFVRSIYRDRSGVLWVGAWSGALNRIDPMRKRWGRLPFPAATPPEKSKFHVRAVLQDSEGNLWVGAKAGLERWPRLPEGESRFEPLGDGGKPVRFHHDPDDGQSLSHDTVRCLYEDRRGDLWVGTLHGLNRLKAEARNSALRPRGTTRPAFERYRHDPGNPNSLSDDFVNCLFEDDLEILWVGTVKGLNWMDRQRRSFGSYRHLPGDPHSLANETINFIFQDSAGRLWVGANGGGLHLLDKKSGRFLRYQHDSTDPRSLSHDRVACMYEDESGTLWLGTIGGGLNKLWGQQFIHYRVADGLPNDVVYAIMGDGLGYLWMSTNRGLSRFDPLDQSFRNFDARDGLQDHEFNFGAAYQGEDGRMFFGGIGGLNFFYPEDIQDDPLAPPVVITELLLANKPLSTRVFQPESPLLTAIDETEALVLSHKNRVITFRFAGLHFARPEKNRYAYKLDGFDDQWIETDAGARTATYTNLAPGRYRFRVKASNRDGVWNEQGVALRLDITPPAWRTWWAYSLYLIAGAVLAVWGFRIYHGKLAEEKSRNRQLRRDLAARQLALQDQRRSLLAAELKLGEQLDLLKEQEKRLRELHAVDRVLRPGQSTEAGPGGDRTVAVPAFESGDEAFLEKARTVLEENIHRPGFGVLDFADCVGLSPRQLQRRITAVTGKKPAQIIRQFRLERAAQLLAQRKGTVAEIAYAVGFANRRHFSDLFQEAYGETPSNYMASVCANAEKPKGQTT